MGPGWGAAIGAAGGLLAGLEARHQGKAWNRWVNQAGWLMSPDSIMKGAYQYNPFLWAALGIDQSKLGKGMANYAGSPYSQSLARLINDPGYIDPMMMNKTFTDIDRGAARSYASGMGRIGMSGAQGGLGAAFAMASGAGAVSNKSSAMQQYILFREQQRRSDIAMIDQMMQRATELSAKVRESQAHILLNKKPVLGHAGVGANIIKGAMEGAASGMGGMSSADPNKLTGGYQTPQTPSSFGNWSEAPATSTYPTGMGGLAGNTPYPEYNPMGANAPTAGMFGAASNGGALTTSQNAPVPWRP